MIRVGLVDDDALVRAGLGMILGGGDIEVVGQAEDGAAGVRLVQEQQVDVVLMDIRMPVLDGVAATEQITALPDHPKVLVLTTFDADDLVVQALRAGAAGFLLKDTPPADLVRAVHAVQAGDPVLSPAVTRQLVTRVTAADAPSDPSDLASLTEREREVAELIAQGSSNADIASALYMSVPTVKAHVSHILTKLGCDNRVQAAIRVHRALHG